MLSRGGGDYPYLWPDAKALKVRQRQDGRVVNMAVVVTAGVRGRGEGKMLGFGVGASEADLWVSWSFPEGWSEV
ncbi:MAG: transposase [Clostridiales bacterium]|nr:transposase [Clostridiales bacterium]